MRTRVNFEARRRPLIGSPGYRVEEDMPRMRGSRGVVALLGVAIAGCGSSPAPKARVTGDGVRVSAMAITLNQYCSA